ncbi:MAG: type I DNA topoisomerase [Pseudoflavonifractor capillosus]|uniref:type I DNA topoisomerase n=1 Tax=Pseudoflavonifractor capillosus TaxID=106588 RepID=UPI0023F9B12F|nr:type I DNA topoisomerase [Pseudoflavonifractor capillosus]MCI5929666.1 type I DNA topoisomerase [Pseudoflavonifractor capillosus]MDY4659812.1 type I DNA topoisomerase [Pseudoflavonifractor capillosus]
MAKTNLVIVESPAKAKTITKYLGPGYQVKASMGHVRDLPKSKLGVDVEHGFTLDYQPIKGKEEVIDDLKKAAKKSDQIFLATDPDREGEAISWHLKELLDLPDERTHRVTFNEITKKVVNESIANPRAIDMDLVDAQQARRVLDRIVGYQISPLLWKKIRRGLSAGRVQSVATRLVAEREQEIRDFQPEEYWTLEAELERVAPAAGKFKAAFYGREKKMELHSEEEVNTVVSAVEHAPFTVRGVKRQDKQRNPAPPFTTSTLQQEASRKLNMTPRRTMSIAQQLYEGVDIAGEGTVGLITYMRTDSLRLSDEATAAARSFILGRYGQEYYPGKARVYKAKSGAQDAHEAIRPSDVNLTPEDVKKDLTSEQYRLYKLIWSRFLACQMAAAVYDSVTIDVESAGYTFRANHSAIKFSGYMAVYVEGKDEEEDEFQSPLPDLKEGEPLDLRKLNRDQHFTQPPARYTEATLIKALEEKGIGRPSTYAPTVSTILDREYVVKEGKYLRTTPLGEVVTGLMKDKFPDIVDTAFTAHMEEQLDEVETGKVNWRELIGGFYGGFEKELQQAEKDLDGERIKVPDEVSEELCPKCGRNLVIKSGRFGRFLACPGWPECDHTQPIVIEMPGRCPKCGGRILKKTSKRGFAYYGCENNSGRNGVKCDFMTWDVPVKDNCPSCGHTMFKKSGRGFKKPFCINPECPNFLPEDQRGYKKKPAAEETAEAAPAEGEEKAKKTAAKKTAAKKPAEKKTAAKKTAEKKPAAKKTAAKKTTAKKAAKTEE